MLAYFLYQVEQTGLHVLEFMETAYMWRFGIKADVRIDFYQFKANQYLPPYLCDYLEFLRTGKNDFPQVQLHLPFINK